MSIVGVGPICTTYQRYSGVNSTWPWAFVAVAVELTWGYFLMADMCEPGGGCKPLAVASGLDT